MRAAGALIALSLAVTGLAVVGNPMSAQAASFTSGVSDFTVPSWVNLVRIEARGANGGGNGIDGTGGLGAIVRADVAVTPGADLLVGVNRGGGAGGAAGATGGRAGQPGGGTSYVKCTPGDCNNDLSAVVQAGGGGGAGGRGIDTQTDVDNDGDDGDGDGGNAGFLCPPPAERGDDGVGGSTTNPLADGGDGGLGGGRVRFGTQNFTDCTSGGSGGQSNGTAGGNGGADTGGAGGASRSGGGGGGGGAGFRGGGGGGSGELRGPGGGGGGGTSYVDPNATNVSLSEQTSSGTPRVTFAYRPQAPHSVNAEPGIGSATVAWTITDTGGILALTGQTVRCIRSDGSSCGSQPLSGTARSATFTGLTSGQPVAFTVQAFNSMGASDLSSQSNVVTPTSATPAPTALYTERFNTQPTGWTVTSSSGSTAKWHATSACGANRDDIGLGEYFGVDSTCTFKDNTQAYGTLTSPVISGLPSAYTLSLFSKRKVESCATTCNRDQTIIHVNYQDGAGWRQVYYKDADDPSPTTPTWEQLSFRLTPPTNTGKVQVRFTFQSASSMNNAFYGWAVDVIQILQ